MSDKSPFLSWGSRAEAEIAFDSGAKRLRSAAGKCEHSSPCWLFAGMNELLCPGLFLELETHEELLGKVFRRVKYLLVIVVYFCDAICVHPFQNG